MPDYQNDPKALAAVMQRAATNRAFRAQLLTEPRTAIKVAFGIVIPDSFRIRFVEKDRGTDALVVLPDFIDPRGELSDDDLTNVAGGMESDYSWSEEPPHDELL